MPGFGFMADDGQHGSNAASVPNVFLSCAVGSLVSANIMCRRTGDTGRCSRHLDSYLLVHSSLVFRRPQESWRKRVGVRSLAVLWQAFTKKELEGQSDSQRWSSARLQG